MIGWLLDTNVISEISRRNGDDKVLAWARMQDEASLFISVLTLAEFDKGIHNLPFDSPVRARIAAALAVLENRFGERVLPLDNAIVRRWGRIAGDCLLRTGKQLPVIDALLAATALEHDLGLATRNTKDFGESGAIIFNPWLDNPTDYPILPLRTM